jgi:RNA polymerase sigma-70 factor (ECF subfamily)
MPNYESQIEDWIRNARKGRTDAQRAIYSHFYGYGMSICIRYAHHQEEAEEILDDGFIKVFKNLDNYTTGLPFKAWFRRILINTAIDYHRKYQKHNSVLEIAHAQHISTDADAITNLSAQEILNFVQQLPPSYRMVFNLYIIEGYKHKEISEQLGITEATSRATLATARHKLQKMILTNSYHQQKKVNG